MWSWSISLGLVYLIWSEVHLQKRSNSFRQYPASSGEKIWSMFPQCVQIYEGFLSGQGPRFMDEYVGNLEYEARLSIRGNAENGTEQSPYCRVCTSNDYLILMRMLAQAHSYSSQIAD